MTGSRQRALFLLVLIALTLFLYWHNLRPLAFVGDDAFIAFRYSKHLTQGLGLVWNAGERVEGFTSLSWVLLIAAGLGLGLDPAALANTLGILSGLGILALLLAYSRVAFGEWSPLGMLAPLMLVLNRSFVAWSTSGLETQFFSLLVLAATLALFVECRREARGVLSSYLFAAATLTRPEGLLFFIVAGCFRLAHAVRTRQPMAAVLRWGLPCATIVLAVTVWKRIYFGFWLPNTFYAKVPGVWLEQGLDYLAVFASQYRIAWVMLPVVVLLVVRRELEHWTLFAGIVAYALYVALIGGDRFEFRFMVVLLPPLYWLFASAVQAASRSAALSRFPPQVAILVAGYLALYGVFPARMPDPGRVRAEVGPIGLETVEDTKAFAEYQLERAAELQSMMEQGLLPEDLRIAAGAAGVVPYVTGLYTIDVVGLNDIHIAHTVTRDQRVPAHRKLAPRAYLEEKRIDMIETDYGFVLPFAASTRRARCVGPVRCLRAGPYLLLFETTLDDEALARRFSKLQLIH